MVDRKRVNPTNFDGITESQTHHPRNSSADTPSHRFCGSARMTYTICAFLNMVIQLCMRNTLNLVILCMVKPEASDLTIRSDEMGQRCNSQSVNETKLARDFSNGDLPWTRADQFTLQSSFYYGYIITLPIAGRLADKFGGKLFFVHSITAQAVVFSLIPIVARFHFGSLVVIIVIQGLIAGFGNPALYMLFSTWAHPTERTAVVSFAFGGYSLGALIIFPLSSMLCILGWESVFYIVGGVSLVFGICCHFLVYSTLEDHPRISEEEYQYLRSQNKVKSKDTVVPWKSIFTSIPVYAFTLTHIFHSYVLTVLTLTMPRFLKEAMGYDMSTVGIYSSAPFLGMFISKFITVSSCSKIESRPNLNLTKFRRIVYVTLSCASIAFLIGIIVLDCFQRTLVVTLSLFIGIASDVAFSGAYWPSLLNIAPPFAGLLSGIATCLSTLSGILAPYAISAIVKNATNEQWDLVLLTLVISYTLSATVYGCFGSSDLQPWAANQPSNQSSNQPSSKNTSPHKVTT